MLAEQKTRQYYRRISHVLANQAAFHGAKVRPSKFNPFAGPSGIDAGSWRQWAEKAKEQLPDELEEDEIQKRWEEFKSGK